MSTPTPNIVIFTNTFARPINSANTGAGAKNQDGSFNASTNRGGGNEHSLTAFNLLRSTGKIHQKPMLTVINVAAANSGNWRNAA